MSRKAYLKELNGYLDIIRDDPWLQFRHDNDSPTPAEFGKMFAECYDRQRRAGPKTPIARAFAAADLQLENVEHWFLLMWVFCEIHFSVEKKRKRTKRGSAYMTLLEERVRNYRANNPGSRRKAEVSKIQEMFAEDYGKRNFDTLRRNIASIGKVSRDQTTRKRPPNKAGFRTTILKKLRTGRPLSRAEREAMALQGQKRPKF